METTYKKKILILGALCLVFLAGVVILSYLGQRKTTQHRAFGTGATLKLTTANANPSIGDEFEVEAKIDAAEKITIYRLAITYDKTKVEIVELPTAPGFVVGPKFGYTNGFTDDKNGLLLLQSAYVVPASGTRNPADLPTGNNTLLAKFKIKTKVAGTTQIGFKDVGNIINGYNPGQDDVVVSVTTKTPLAITVTEETPPIGHVDVSLDPSTATHPVGQNFDLNIKVNAGTFKVAAMNLELAFDKEQLEIVRFAPDPVAFTPDMSLSDDTGYDPVDLGNTTGIAKLFASTLKTTLQTGVFKAGTITLKGKKDGVAGLTIRKVNTSFFGGFNADKTLEGSLSINEVVDGSYTIGAGVTGPGLNFKIKFQGVTTKRADQKVMVIIKKVGFVDEVINNVNVTSDDNGIYSGTVSPERAISGGGYAIFIKGPKHLSRKFCLNNQDKRCGLSGGSIMISPSVNNFDFSKIALEAGDLPDPNDSNKQNGVANSVDVSLIVSRVTKNTAANLAVADVNFDGVLQWDDVTLVLNTLETKYEEDY